MNEAREVISKWLWAYVAPTECANADEWASETEMLTMRENADSILSALKEAGYVVVRIVTVPRPPFAPIDP